MPDRKRMLARQRVLGGFGDFALRSDSLDEVLNEACRLAAEGLDADLAKILEIEEGGERVLVRAGVGWKPGVVGEKRFSLEDGSSEAYSIKAGHPIVTADIEKETRFRFADLLIEHGVAALVNAPIILPGGKPYGLLQVDSRTPSGFNEEDVAFLRTYTAVLGPVIDRLHKLHSLERALEANRRLLQELQHRVKNHIGIITSLVRMRARQVESEEARKELEGIGERVETLRLLHEQLHAAAAADRLSLRPFLTQLVRNLCRLNEEQSGPVTLDFRINDVELTPDLAVPLGLILNEFVTNSLKYAFDGKGGAIVVSIEALPHEILHLQVCDDGKGLPGEPQTAGPGSSTGMKLIEALAHQIGAKPVWSSPRPGTSLHLEFPRSDGSEQTTATGA